MLGGEAVDLYSDRIASVSRLAVAVTSRSSGFSVRSRPRKWISWRIRLPMAKISSRFQTHWQPTLRAIPSVS